MQSVKYKSQNMQILIRFVPISFQRLSNYGAFQSLRGFSWRGTSRRREEKTMSQNGKDKDPGCRLVRPLPASEPTQLLTSFALYVQIFRFASSNVSLVGTTLSFQLTLF